MNIGLRHIITGVSPAESSGENRAVGDVSLNARPHPGPLPRGEGKTVAAALKNQVAGLVGRVDELSKSVPGEISLSLGERAGVRASVSTNWLAERGCPSRSASSIPAGWSFSNRPPLSAVTVPESCRPAIASDALRLGQPRSGFTLMEVMVSMGLLSLIVIVLMTVFSNTQSAFRAGVTQTDVMANGRATMDMIAADARLLTPSHDVFTNLAGYHGAVNLYNGTHGYLYQGLPATGSSRTNVIQTLFLLSKENTRWRGIGYAVDINNTHSIFPLYRFYEETNLDSNPGTLYTNFLNSLVFPITNTTVWSHLMDGVVHLVVRAYDTNGFWLANSNSYAVGQAPFIRNTVFYGQFPGVYPSYGEESFIMYSNALPASVEIQLGVLEDTAIRRLESLVNANYGSYTNYLSQQANRVQIFRQRVSVPNCDPSAYQ